MGPRPFGRGRTNTPKSSGGAWLLQWGRDLSVAEGIRDKPDGRAPTELQWGRDLSVAEGLDCKDDNTCKGLLQWGRDLSVAEGAASTARARGRPGFNGAATFRSRKAADWSRADRREYELQWGRDLSVAEGTAVYPWTRMNS